MLEGNAIHDLLFDGEARNLDIEDAVESCGHELHISHYDQPTGYDLRSGDVSALVNTLQDRASNQQRQVAVLITAFRSVAVLIWETGDFAIVDSHAHDKPYGAIISYTPAGQTSGSDIVTWLNCQDGSSILQ